MMCPIWLAKQIGRMALLVLIGFMCSDLPSSSAEDIAVSIKRAPVAVPRSPDRSVGEQGLLTTSNGLVAKNRFQESELSMERGNPLQLVPLTSLTATRERPIFLPTRRPAPRVLPVQVAVAASVDLGRPNFSLVGAISGEHEDIAIVRDDTTKVIIRLRTGESHSGWTLETAKGREVTLHKSGKTAIITLAHPASK